MQRLTISLQRLTISFWLYAGADALVCAIDRFGGCNTHSRMPAPTHTHMLAHTHIYPRPLQRPRPPPRLIFLVLVLLIALLALVLLRPPPARSHPSQGRCGDLGQQVHPRFSAARPHQGEPRPLQLQPPLWRIATAAVRLTRGRRCSAAPSRPTPCCPTTSGRSETHPQSATTPVVLLGSARFSATHGRSWVFFQDTATHTLEVMGLQVSHTCIRRRVRPSL